MSENYRTLTFGRTQQTQQKPGERHIDLHERLRDMVIKSFETLRSPTRIITPSWYTGDVSDLLGIPDAAVVCTSTCKHETPYKIFVGRREKGWMQNHPTIANTFIYELDDLGRELTEPEKHSIYDRI